jgi:hypothetical protein
VRFDSEGGMTNFVSHPLGRAGGRRATEYDGFEYAAVPVNYATFLIRLCTNIFQLRAAPITRCRDPNAVDSSGDDRAVGRQPEF